ncbi:hypothetical protein QBC34DRAFT_469574 [Podospora aff. communis PSN243]|uniref:Uncharacterized protein n=1 Tax=Podospora aff. communis PSN243 TaxID=3040156 RepID=A0AAV9GEP3_9PEZI|nr:hypothetical protein QBC34DRAFT_469574 [Podospora aff. communis PSN243]
MDTLSYSPALWGRVVDSPNIRSMVLSPAGFPDDHSERGSFQLDTGRKFDSFLKFDTGSPNGNTLILPGQESERYGFNETQWRPESHQHHEIHGPGGAQLDESPRSRSVWSFAVVSVKLKSIINNLNSAVKEAAAAVGSKRHKGGPGGGKSSNSGGHTGDGDKRLPPGRPEAEEDDGEWTMVSNSRSMTRLNSIDSYYSCEGLRLLSPSNGQANPDSRLYHIKASRVRESVLQATGQHPTLHSFRGRYPRPFYNNEGFTSLLSQSPRLEYPIIHESGEPNPGPVRVVYNPNQTPSNTFTPGQPNTYDVVYHDIRKGLNPRRNFSLATYHNGRTHDLAA